MTEIEKLKINLGKIAECEFFPEDYNLLITRQFSIRFLNNTDYFHSEKGISRSNWTQHTANSFFNTCKDLNLKCEFEVENRHDGAIRNDLGEMYICAEWEYETNTIFKENGEIEKIAKTCTKHNACEGILLTYKIEEDFLDFSKKVYDKWNKLLPKKHNIRLFLLTVILDKNSETKEKHITGIRTLIFGNQTIDLLEDLIFN